MLVYNCRVIDMVLVSFDCFSLYIIAYLSSTFSMKSLSFLLALLMFCILHTAKNSPIHYLVVWNEYVILWLEMSGVFLCHIYGFNQYFITKVSVNISIVFDSFGSYLLITFVFVQSLWCSQIFASGKECKACSLKFISKPRVQFFTNVLNSFDQNKSQRRLCSLMKNEKV